MINNTFKYYKSTYSFVTLMNWILLVYLKLLYLELRLWLIHYIERTELEELKKIRRQRWQCTSRPCKWKCSCDHHKRSCMRLGTNSWNKRGNPQASRKICRYQGYHNRCDNSTDRYWRPNKRTCTRRRRYRCSISRRLGSRRWSGGSR